MMSYNYEVITYFNDLLTGGMPESSFDDWSESLNVK